MLAFDAHPAGGQLSIGKMRANNTSYLLLQIIISKAMMGDMAPGVIQSRGSSGCTELLVQLMT